MFEKNFHTPVKKSSKITPMISHLGNAYYHKGTDHMAGKSKYYRQNLPSLPMAHIGSNKKIYKWSLASSDPFGKVTSFSLYSNQGSIRPYNEDRVVEYHTTLKSEKGIDCNFSFFGVYDGHGGDHCSKYLWKELHLALVDDPNLLKNPTTTMRKHISELDTKFLKNYLENPTNTDYQRAGSCLNVVVIIDSMCYVGNVGDCRSIMSTEGGRVVYQLSRDHKPSDPSERDRVIDAGGKIYVSSIKQTNSQSGLSLQRTDKLITKNDNFVGSTDNAINVIENGGEAFGPHRVIPGRLSVSRAIGDAHAKMKQLGGNANVVISRPDIKKFKINENYDFIVMGSDGLFDKQSNSEIIKQIWRHAIEMYNSQTKNIDKIALKWSEFISKEAIDKKALDNISWNIIIFDNFINTLNGKPVINDNQLTPNNVDNDSFDMSFTPK